MIEAGDKVADTMPVGVAEAAVISFDTIASTKVNHPHFQIALEQTFVKCHELMTANYSSSPLTSNAFLVKNVGDGFICTVGYPFATPNGHIKEELAFELALSFSGIFREQMERLSYPEPLCCAIGISSGKVESYFPVSGPQTFELREAIREKTLAMAKRHEAVVRQIDKFDRAGVGMSGIMVQEAAWLLLPERVQSRFKLWNAEESGKQIRDSNGAKRAYYMLLPAAAARVGPSSALAPQKHQKIPA
jgi:hypothetical protein